MTKTDRETVEALASKMEAVISERIGASVKSTEAATLRALLDERDALREALTTIRDDKAKCPRAADCRRVAEQALGDTQ